MLNTTSCTSLFAKCMNIGSLERNLKILSPNELKRGQEVQLCKKGKTVRFKPLNMLHTPIRMFLALWFDLELSLLRKVPFRLSLSQNRILDEKTRGGFS
jgi:hypothetical protein